jgi:hypothetical protein
MEKECLALLLRVMEYFHQEGDIEYDVARVREELEL